MGLSHRKAAENAKRKILSLTGERPVRKRAFSFLLTPLTLR